MFKNTPVIYDDHGNPYWQVMYDNKPVYGYYMNIVGKIHTIKKGDLAPMSDDNSCCKNGGKGYPKIKLKHRGKDLTVDIHVLVCGTFHGYHPIVRHPDLSEDIWNATPPESQFLLNKGMWQADHIVGKNHMNYNPTNIQWLLGSENRKKSGRDQKAENKTKKESKADIISAKVRVEFKKRGRRLKYDPATYTLIVTLKSEGFSPTEIAKRTGLPLGTFRSHLNRLGIAA